MVGKFEPDKVALQVALELARPCGPTTSVPSVRRGAISFEYLSESLNYCCQSRSVELWKMCMCVESWKMCIKFWKNCLEVEVVHECAVVEDCKDVYVCRVVEDVY